MDRSPAVRRTIVISSCRQKTLHSFIQRSFHGGELGEFDNPDAVQFLPRVLRVEVADVVGKVFFARQALQRTRFLDSLRTLDQERVVDLASRLFDSGYGRDHPPRTDGL